MDVLAEPPIEPDQKTTGGFYTFGYSDPTKIFTTWEIFQGVSTKFAPNRINKMNPNREKAEEIPIGAAWDFWFLKYGESTPFSALEMIVNDTNCFEHAVAGRLMSMGYLTYDKGCYTLSEQPFSKQLVVDRASCK